MRLGYLILTALLSKLEELSWILCTMTSFYYLDQNSFRFFFHIKNLVIPVRFKEQKSSFAQENKTPKDSGSSSGGGGDRGGGSDSSRSIRMTPSCKWPILSSQKYEYYC